MNLFDFNLTLPITDPTWVFFLVLIIILFAPMILGRLHIPHIIGMILAGVLIGEHGFHVLDRDSSFELFGKVGLYYIMFLAGLEMEYEFKGNRSETEGSDKDKTRLAFAGLRFGDYGSLDYGRNYGVAYDVGAWTDVLPEFGGDTWTQTDVFMTQRATGVATYRNNNFFGLVDGLNFALQYQGKNDSAAKANNWKGRDEVESNGDGFGLSATYDYEGFGVAATYAKSDRTDGQVSYAKASPLNASGKTAEVWATGLKYDANNIYLATTYSETQNMTVFGDDHIANKAKNFEAVAQYQFDFGLRPSIAYLHSRGENIGAFGNQDLVEYIDVGATYYFNKNMSTFVDYKINLIDESDFTKKSGVATDNIVAVGMTYQF